MENSNNGGTSSKTNNDDSSSDDDSVTTIAKNVKKSKHSHSSCANDDITRHQNNLLITNNANVNLGTVYRTDRFLSHGGIPSESLAAFQQEDSSIASQSHSDPIRSQRMENRLRLFSSRTKGDRNRYILSVMQPEKDQIEQSPTSEQNISSGTSNFTEREQRVQRRNLVENVSHAANSNTDVTNSSNSNDHPASHTSSSSETSDAVDFSPFSSNEESQNIFADTPHNHDLGNQHSSSSSSNGNSNAFHAVNENNNHNSTTFTTNQANSDNGSNTPHHMFEQMRQAEYNLHKHTAGTPHFNNETIACIELAHILDKCDAPKLVFDQIIKWASKHRDNLTNSPPTRKTFYSKLEKTLSFTKHLPQKVVVELSGNEASEVTRHDPVSSIFSLLTSKVLSPGGKRYIFGTRPNTFTPQLGCTNRNDITSSRWFFNTYRKYSQLPKYLNGRVKFMCVPIILFIDETHLDRQGSATICPVSYTLGIFNEATKKNPHAWRHLGFVPKDVVRAVIGNTQAENKRLKLADFHAHLRAILLPLKEFQDNGPYGWHFQDLISSGQNEDLDAAARQEYDLFFPVGYVIGDIKGHNILTMRYNDHNKSNSISRECDCLRTNGYQSPTQCRHISYSTIKELQLNAINGQTIAIVNDAKKLLQSKSFHFGNPNAFDGIDFGENKYGINFACTPCLLHSWMLRFPDDIFNAFIEVTLGLSDTNSSITQFLDACPDIIRSCVRQSDRKHLDISPFSIAIMKDKLYYAKEKHARLFAIYIYGMTTYSLEMSSSIAQQNEFLKLIELSLCLYEYLYQPHFPIRDCEPLDENTFQCRANVKIGNWKTMYKRVLNIEDESLKFPKWHDLDHFGAYIDFFGSAKHLDGGTSESNFKDTAKKPAKRSNKLRTRINHDVAQDLTHRRLVMSAMCVLSGGVVEDPPQPEMNDDCAKNNKSSLFAIHVQPNRTGIEVIWKKDNVIPLMNYSAKIQEEIFQLLFSRRRGILQGEPTVVNGFTTLDHKGNIFRGHPWFNPSLPWFDYAYINWHEDNDDDLINEEFQRERLAKIICFVDLTQHEVKDGVLNTGNHRYQGQCVIVQSILETGIDNGYSPTEKAMDAMDVRQSGEREDHLKLVTCWELEENFRILPVSLIADTAFAFQDIIRGPDEKLEHGEFVFEVKKRKEWRNLFEPRSSANVNV